MFLNSRLSKCKCSVETQYIYTPFHLVESVENCWLCMRQCLAFSSYTQVMHCALAITLAVEYDASVKHWIMRNRSLPSLPLSCTGYNFYWLDEVNRSIVVLCQINKWWLLNLVVGILHICCVETGNPKISSEICTDGDHSVLQRFCNLIFFFFGFSYLWRKVYYIRDCILACLAWGHLSLSNYHRIPVLLTFIEQLKSKLICSRRKRHTFKSLPFIKHTLKERAPNIIEWLILLCCTLVKLAGVDKLMSSSGAKFSNENPSSYPSYINVIISSIFLVISERCSLLPYFIHAWLNG